MRRRTQRGKGTEDERERERDVHRGNKTHRIMEPETYIQRHI